MTIRAGILIGGRSSRMGSPKHLLLRTGITFAEHLTHTVGPYVDGVVFLGSGRLPDSIAHFEQLPDDPSIQGPMAGILPALRSHRDAWLIVACDLPFLSSYSIEWLLAQRSPGKHILIPQNTNGILQPHFSIFEPEALNPIEDAVMKGLRAPKELGRLVCAASPRLPKDIETELRNVNVPDDLRAVEGL